MKKNFKFIDLFSGIGGFHQAMSQLGGECVFASEIDKYANETYLENYKIDSNRNIFDVDEKNIPKHDVLCAGFPCVAFSKAGKQEGFKDQTRGTLFFEIARVLEFHHTPYIILENVRNLTSHDHGNTWKVIKGTLRDLGYRLTQNPLILSPHQFGIPQLRERVIILGEYEPENVDIPLEISFNSLIKKDENSIYTVLTKGKVEDKYYISEHEKYILQAWDEFHKGVFPKIIGFPIWSWAWKIKKIPNEYPTWKRDFINKNIQLYKDNKVFIDQWLKKYKNLEDFSDTEKKMEWQAGETINSVWEGVIQSRPSGIRIKSPTCFPALVAMVQIPIIGKYKRRLTPKEAGRLQSFPDTFIPNKIDLQAYKQFGNAINVDVIRECAIKLFNYKD